jgi:hypothetical protein
MLEMASSKMDTVIILAYVKELSELKQNYKPLSCLKQSTYALLCLVSKRSKCQILQNWPVEL